MGDDKYILFINWAYNNAEDYSDLAKLIHDFGCTKPSDMYFSEMCKMMEDMRNNAQEAGEKIGMTRMLIDLVKNLTLA